MPRIHRTGPQPPSWSSRATSGIGAAGRHHSPARPPPTRRRPSSSPPGKGQRARQAHRQIGRGAAGHRYRRRRLLRSTTRDAGAEIVERVESVDVLINNAGVHTMRQADHGWGLPEMITVNYLAPWLLTGTVLPALRRADHARVVTVASSRRHAAPASLRIPEDLTDTRSFNALQSSPVYREDEAVSTSCSASNSPVGSPTPLSTRCLNPGFNTTGLGRRITFCRTAGTAHPAGAEHRRSPPRSGPHRATGHRRRAGVGRLLLRPIRPPHHPGGTGR